MINEFLIKPLMHLPLFYGVSSFGRGTIEVIKISRSLKVLHLKYRWPPLAIRGLVQYFMCPSCYFFSSVQLQVAIGRPLVLLLSGS